MTQFLRKIPIVGTGLWELVRHPDKAVSPIVSHGNLAVVAFGLLGFWTVVLFVYRATFVQAWASATADLAGSGRTILLTRVYFVSQVLSLYPSLWIVPSIIWHVLLRALGRKGPFVSLLTTTGHAFLVPIIATLPLTVLRMIRYFTMPFFDSALTAVSCLWIASICALSIRQLYEVSKAMAATITVVGAILTPLVYALVHVMLLLFLASVGVILRLTGTM